MPIVARDECDVSLAVLLHGCWIISELCVARHLQVALLFLRILWRILASELLELGQRRVRNGFWCGRWSWSGSRGRVEHLVPFRGRTQRRVATT